MIYNLDYPFIKKPYCPMKYTSNDYVDIIAGQDWKDDYYLSRADDYLPVEISGLKYGETVYSVGPSSVEYIMYVTYDNKQSYPYTITFHGGNEPVFTGVSGPTNRYIEGMLYEVNKDYRTCSYGSDYSFSVRDNTPGTESEVSRGKVLNVILPYEFEVGTINTLHLSAPQGSSKYYGYRIYLPDSGGTYMAGQGPTYSSSERRSGRQIGSLYDIHSTYVPITGYGMYVQRLS